MTARHGKDRGAKTGPHRGKEAAPPDSWHGEEVADAPGDEAERAADRAAGRTPGPSHREALTPDESRAPVRRSRDDDLENQEEKRQAAADDHAADRAAGTKRSPKSL
jgi:hypothetical protein